MTMDLQGKGANFRRQFLSDVEDVVRRMLGGITATIAAQKDGAGISDQHRTLNFQGAGVTVSDDPLMRRANILITGGQSPTSTVAVLSSVAAKALTLWNGTGNNAPPANWTTVAFNDAAWAAAVSTGATGGFGPPAGTVPIWPTASPLSNTEQAMLRQAFTLPSGAVSTASITVRADEVMDVYINGTFVISHGSPSPSGITPQATYTVPANLLVSGGSNVIAVLGKNFNPIGAFVAYDLEVTTGNSVQPPPVANWTWVNQGTATAVNSSGGIFLSTPALAGDNLRVLVRPAPATPYVVTASFLPLLYPANIATCGLCFRESVSGRIAMFAWVYNSGPAWFVDKFTNPTTFSAHYLTATPPFHGSYAWFRLVDDGTSRQCLFSVDALNWILLHSVARTDFLVADQVGFFVNANQASGPAAMNLATWVGA